MPMKGGESDGQAVAIEMQQGDSTVGHVHEIDEFSERDQVAETAAVTFEDTHKEEDAESHHGHEEDFTVWKIHEFYGDYPISCYCGLYCSFCFFLILIVVLSVGGVEVLNVTTEFPFYIQSHRSFERQDGAIVAHDDNTWSPAGAGGGGVRTEFDDTVVHLMYIAGDDSNVLTTDRLTAIKAFEDKLTGKADWKNEMCYLVNGECYRPTSAAYFYSADSNAQPFFPMSGYDHYPSYNNTVNFKSSYYSKPVEYDFTLDFSSPDSVSSHWAQYGTASGEPYYEYFETAACERQRPKCDEVHAGVSIPDPNDEGFPERFMQGACYDANAMLAGRNRTEEENTDTYDILNCDQLMDYTLGLGVGCDDYLEFLELPDVTTRMICCESCFYRWFPQKYKNVDGSEIELNATTCAADVSNTKLLEVCLDHNKGEFTTTSEIEVTGSNDPAIQEAIGNLFTSSGIAYEKDQLTYAADTLEVYYPWSSQQSAAMDILQASDFNTKLEALLPGSEVNHKSSVAETEAGKDEVYSYTVNSNPFWQVTDGEFGVNADPAAARTARAVKTMFFLGMPLEGYTSTSDDRGDQIIDLGQLCYDNWQDIMDDGVGHGMETYWYCEQMDTAFTNVQLMTDFMLIMFTVVFVFLYMTYATGSYWLSMNGMFMIFMNFVPTIFLYRFICQQKFFGILQIMSMFLILAIGADDIFVLIDTWAQTNCEHFKDRSIKERLSFTLSSAGKVMLTTSLSTIFSFIANCSSSFPAIYTFGMFCAILIFVNYCAVCLFYPAVLVLHELYFDGEGIDRCVLPKGLGVYCNCSLRTEPEDIAKRYERYASIPERKHLIPDPTEKRKIDMWFANQFYGFVHRARMAIIFVGAVMFCVFLASAATIQPDPNPPNIFPDGHNYGVFWDKFTDYFTRSTSEQAVVAWIVTGLTPNGIHRGDDHDPTDPAELGEPTYDVNFNPFGKEEMEWLCAMCDDLELGQRYGDSESRMVDETPEGGEEAVQCPFTEFRNWIWSMDPEASYDMDGGINPLTLDYLDSNLVACMKAENGGAAHEVGTWPITGFWNNWQRWEDWLKDEMPVSNPGYTKGMTNWGYWSSQLYYNEDDWTSGKDADGNAFSWQCSGVTIENTPKLFQVNVRLSVSSKFEYTDGITLYEDWEDWLNKWMTGEVGHATEFVPTTIHCDGLSPIDKCEARDGCKWENPSCLPKSIPYPPAEMPAGVKSMFVTDGGNFSYYYLQEQLLVECITGIALALALAFVILNWATKNYIVATISTVVISMIVLMIIGFCVFLDWKLGILESIIFVMVVGMSVDYVVHLGESYLEAGEDHQDRHSRARDMLEVRGFSILSGAISTLGGIFFLFFAFIVFFYKFAVVIFFLIACSLAYSLLFFTAIMDSFGPSGEFGEWHTVFDDMKHVRDGDMSICECIHNCCVPHDSLVAPRTMVNVLKGVDDDDDDDQPLR